ERLVMKILRTRIIACCLASLCFGSGGWAQANSLPSKPPRAAKGPPAQKSRLVALRIVGSNVKNPQGQYLGWIEEAAVNPNTGQIEFAMVQIYYPKLST